MAKHGSKLTNHNRLAWDEIAKSQDEWFRAVTPTELDAAAEGILKIKVTPTKSVPLDWLGELKNKRVLCLAGAGGRQGPLLASAGAIVTVFDISEVQLQRDRDIAAAQNLSMNFECGDMRDLERFEAGSFDLIVNPCSLCYLDSLGQLWDEMFRVTKPGGGFVSGLINPVNYVFDAQQRDNGELWIRHQIPYGDHNLSTEELETLKEPDHPLEFGHSLQAQIGGITASGFSIVGFYEDRWGGDDVLSEHLDVFFAILAVKARE